MANRGKLSNLTAGEVEAIILNSYDDIYKYCYWKIKDCAEAEDLTQETFLRFVQALSDYKEQGKPKALLYTIARNLCLNWYKQRKPLALSEAPDIVPTEADTEHLENQIVLEQCIQLLPPDQQEILLLRYGQELQVNEIAEVMGMSRFAVMYRIRNALDALNKELRKGGVFI
ncbi:RNA polymerase sigma factor [Roseburia hominis]